MYESGINLCPKSIIATVGGTTVEVNGLLRSICETIL